MPRRLPLRQRVCVHRAGAAFYRERSFVGSARSRWLWQERARPRRLGRRKCVSRGAELQPGAKFCKACGKPTAAAVDRPEAAPTAHEAAAPPAAPERSPISAFAPRASSPRPWEAPPITATPQFEREARPKVETTQRLSTASFRTASRATRRLRRRGLYQHSPRDLLRRRLRLECARFPGPLPS